MSLSYSDVRDKDFGDMTHAEARLLICRQVGLNKSPYATFGKADLNSIYRYLTGEFYYPPPDYYTDDSPEAAEIRTAISEEIDLNYVSGPDNNRPFLLDDVRKLGMIVDIAEDRRLKA